MRLAVGLVLVSLLGFSACSDDDYGKNVGSDAGAGVDGDTDGATDAADDLTGADLTP